MPSQKSNKDSANEPAANEPSVQEPSANQPSTNQPSTNQGASSSKPSTRYSIVKKGWGSRPNFQASYGLTMDPDDIAEGNAILDAFIASDRELEQQDAGEGK